MTKQRTERWLEAFAVIGVLILAAALRLIHLPDNPGWYSDEGTMLDIALHLTHDESQYFALRGPTLIAARMPLFPALLSLPLRVFPEPMSVLRHTTALLGVFTVLLLYVTVRSCLGPAGRWPAVASAFVLAVWPNAVIYNRIGFSYNLLAPITLAVFWLLWAYLDRRRVGWVVTAAILVGIGATSDLIAMAFVVPIALVAAYRNWRHALWAIAASFLPLIGYAGWMLYQAPAYFLADLRFIGAKVAGVPLVAQFPVAALNTAHLFQLDPWFLLGLIGLFLLEPGRYRRLGLVLGVLPFFSIARTSTGLATLGYYYLLPVLPVMAMGMATLLLRAAAAIVPVTRDSIEALLAAWSVRPLSARAKWLTARLVALASALMVFLVVLGPLVVSAFTTINGVATRLNTAIDDVMIQPEDAFPAAAFLRTHTRPDDLVVGSPAFAWILTTRVADFQQAVAAAGGETKSFPDAIPAERFAFPATVSDARYVVIDPIWRNWGAPRMPAVREIIAAVERWPLVFRSGEISVYANPHAVE